MDPISIIMTIAIFIIIVVI